MLVAARRRQYEVELRRPRAPRVLTSEGEESYGESAAVGEHALTGTPASPGVVAGRARVVRDPLEQTLLRGEILVAPSTNPAWTRSFSSLVAW